MQSIQREYLYLRIANTILELYNTKYFYRENVIDFFIFSAQERVLIILYSSNSISQCFGAILPITLTFFQIFLFSAFLLNVDIAHFPNEIHLNPPRVRCYSMLIPFRSNTPKVSVGVYNIYMKDKSVLTNNFSISQSKTHSN